ncbi:MAG: hypothetical protein HQ504_10065 [Rhodospirillaceae bacterium]|nr:hypothetical protein [Rhodospirillaceae bacterium]
MTQKTLHQTMERVRPLLAIALIVVLSACSSSDDRAHDYRISHPLKVAPETVSVALGVTTETMSLNSADENRLHLFARDFINRGRSNLMVSVSPSSIHVGERLRALLVSWGVRGDSISVMPVLKQGEIIEMSFVGYKVTPPECGDWSSGSNFNWTNKNHSNFGCSVQRNMGLMVADPGDLKNTQPMTNSPASPSADAIYTPDPAATTSSRALTEGASTGITGSATSAATTGQ